jgi:xanthine dehydrogenase iron-sulfur cluster and FAD-binding subunit A
MTKTKQAVLSNTKVLCPCCGYALIVGATVRLKATRELPQKPVIDYDHLNEVTRQMAEEEYSMKEEAERHG